MGAAPGTARDKQGLGVPAAPARIYRPRRPRASPLYRLIEDHFEEFATVYDERLSRRSSSCRDVGNLTPVAGLPR